ncbi:TPR-1 domain containing protein [Ceratobasidium theobromae]|uniref:TPR-1 domain containing protein n=1 Tax=Ceratobasidium theobromae TaxID=1582974 RepID=A0A5N5QAM3_9AGAM|nr:TPR-1 domain containing protein [Ceratobasidium theobromae]
MSGKWSLYDDDDDHVPGGFMPHSSVSSNTSPQGISESKAIAETSQQGQSNLSGSQLEASSPATATLISQLNTTTAPATQVRDNLRQPDDGTGAIPEPSRNADLVNVRSNSSIPLDSNPPSTSRTSVGTTRRTLADPVSVIPEESEADIPEGNRIQNIAAPPLRNVMDAPSESQGDTAVNNFLETGDIEMANYAIARFMGVLANAERNSSAKLSITEKARIADKLSTVLSQRFEHFGDVDDIEQAMEVQTKLAALAFDNNSGRSIKTKSLAGLGRTLTAQFDHTGDPTDAELALENLTQALETMSRTDPARPALLGDIVKLNLASYRHFDDPSKLEQALTFCQEAINSVPPHSPEKTTISNLLGSTLLARFERSQDLQDVELAIHHLDSVLSNTPPRSPERPKRLRSYGDALLARFKHQRNQGDLENAIRIQLEALELLDPEKTAFAEVTGSLAMAFHARYKNSGNNIEDLDNAIKYFKTTVELTPFSNPDHPRITDLLGKSFISKYRSDRNLQYLDYAVMLQQQSLVLTPLESRHYANRLEGLGYAYSKRYRTYPRHRRTPAQSDKLEAEKYLKQAMERDPAKSGHITHELTKLNELRSRA